MHNTVFIYLYMYIVIVCLFAVVSHLRLFRAPLWSFSIHVLWLCASLITVVVLCGSHWGLSVGILCFCNWFSLGCTFGCMHVKARESVCA